jgi:hypothetical protein
MVLFRLRELDADVSFLLLGSLIAGHLDSIASSSLRLACYLSLLHTHIESACLVSSQVGAVLTQEVVLCESV